MVSLGGALGGLAVGLVAPKLFNTYYEFGVGPGRHAADRGLRDPRHAPGRCRCWCSPPSASPATTSTRYVDSLAADTRVMTRNFYGTLRVKDIGADERTGRGAAPDARRDHARRAVPRAGAPPRSRPPTTARPRASGGSSACSQPSGPLRVGVIGLGTGTLAAYGRPGDVYRFYEINPQVVEIARRRVLLPERQRREDRDRAGRRAPRHGARAAAAVRRARDRRVLERLDSGAPHHARGDGRLSAPHEARRRDRVSRDQPLPAPRSGGEAHRRRPGPAHRCSSSTTRRRATSPRPTGCWSPATRRCSSARRSPRAPSEIDDIPGLGVWTDDFNNLFQILK